MTNPSKDAPVIRPSDLIVMQMSFLEKIIDNLETDKKLLKEDIVTIKGVRSDIWIFKAQCELEIIEKYLRMCRRHLEELNK